VTKRLLNPRIWCVLSATVFPSHSIAQQEPAQDQLKRIIEAYGRNRERFRSMKVHWKRTDRVTDAWLEARYAQAEALDQRAENLVDSRENTNDESDPLRAESTEFSASTLAHREAANLRNQAQAIRAEAANRRVSLEQYSLFAKDEGWLQIRVAPENWGLGKSESEWRLPETSAYDASTSPPSLPALLLDFYLLSETSAPSTFSDGLPPARIRVWHGGYSRSANSWVHGVLTNNWRLDDRNIVPPFGVTEPSRATTTYLSAYDQMLLRAPPDSSDFAISEIKDPSGGGPRILLELRGAVAPPNNRIVPADIARYGDKLVARSLTRLTLDPARAYLPTRVEWDVELSLDGRRLPNPIGARPHTVLEDTVIQSIPGAGYYPTKGVVRNFGLDVGESPKLYSVEELLARTAKAAPLVLHDEQIWHAVEVGLDSSAIGSSLIGFPLGETLLDETRGAAVVIQRHGALRIHEKAFLPWLLITMMLAGWLLFGLAVGARRCVYRIRRSAPARAA
jgi:hypothetical protein